MAWRLRIGILICVSPVGALLSQERADALAAEMQAQLTLQVDYCRRLFPSPSSFIPVVLLVAPVQK